MSSIRTFFGHKLVKAVSFAVMTVALVAGVFVYASGNGGIGSSKPSVTWLTMSNVQSTLNISQDSTGSVVAKPAKPVLLLECGGDACDSKSLDLSGVIQHYGDKVTIVALNPYTQPQLASLIDQQFLIPNAEQKVALQFAIMYLQQNNQPVTQASVQQLAQNQNFQQAVQQQLAGMALFQPVYPKFFLLSAGDFQLLAAKAGIVTRDDVIKFVDAGLNPPAQTAPSSPATGTGSTGSAATSGTPAPTTGTTGTQSSATPTPSASGSQNASGTGK